MYSWYLKPGIDQLPKGVGKNNEEKNSKDRALRQLVLMGQEDGGGVSKEDFVIGLLGGLHEVISVYYDG